MCSSTFFPYVVVLTSQNGLFINFCIKVLISCSIFIMFWFWCFDVSLRLLLEKLGYLSFTEQALSLRRCKYSVSTETRLIILEINCHHRGQYSSRRVMFICVFVMYIYIELFMSAIIWYCINCHFLPSSLFNLVILVQHMSRKMAYCLSTDAHAINC